MLAFTLTTSAMPAASSTTFGKKERALGHAAKTGNSKRLKRLIAQKAPINAYDNLGRTALHHAADCGHIEIVKLLIKAKADVDARDNYGLAPINLAAFHRHKAIVKLLKTAMSQSISYNLTD